MQQTKINMQVIILHRFNAVQQPSLMASLNAYFAHHE